MAEFILVSVTVNPVTVHGDGNANVQPAEAPLNVIPVVLDPPHYIVVAPV